MPDYHYPDPSDPTLRTPADSGDPKLLAAPAKQDAEGFLAICGFLPDESKYEVARDEAGNLCVVRKDKGYPIARYVQINPHTGLPLGQPGPNGHQCLWCGVAFEPVDGRLKCDACHQRQRNLMMGKDHESEPSSEFRTEKTEDQPND